MGVTPEGERKTWNGIIVSTSYQAVTWNTLDLGWLRRYIPNWGNRVVSIYLTSTVIGFVLSPGKEFTLGKGNFLYLRAVP